MSGKYWFSSAFGGGFVIGMGNDEIANTPSREVAQKITAALNAMAGHPPEPTRKYQVLNRLKEWRVRRDLTQQQLADLLGVTQGTIARYEKSNVALDTITLARFANALQVEPHLLITNHGEEQCVQS